MNDLPESPFRADMLQGSTFLVTGGGSGIGLQITEQLARHGAKVAVLSRSPQRVAQAASWAGRWTDAIGVVADVRDPKSVAEAVAAARGRLGPISGIVNSAAGNFRSPAESMSEKAFRTVVDIDLVGTFNATLAVVGEMLERGDGNIVNVLTASPTAGFPYASHAAAAKSGLFALTRTWAQEWGGRGVRANSVGPGPVPTAGAARALFGADGPDWEDAYAPLRQRTPLGRLATAHDVAMAVLFLAGPASRACTGVHVPVDAGLGLPRDQYAAGNPE
jgi:peroxisomal 2,4-dienoyl-CoA reductase